MVIETKKRHILIQRPKVIQAYNEYMGEVGLIDMLLSLYRINVDIKKYIKIAFHLIDLLVVNVTTPLFANTDSGKEYDVFSRNIAIV